MFICDIICSRNGYLLFLVVDDWEDKTLNETNILSGDAGCCTMVFCVFVMGRKLGLSLGIELGLVTQWLL